MLLDYSGLGWLQRKRESPHTGQRKRESHYAGRFRHFRPPYMQAPVQTRTSKSLNKNMHVRFLTYVPAGWASRHLPRLGARGSVLLRGEFIREDRLNIVEEDAARHGGRCWWGGQLECQGLLLSRLDDGRHVGPVA